MIVYIFGNANLPFLDFMEYYAPALEEALQDIGAQFIVCDFQGVDTLAMEYLKTRTAQVTVYHMFEKPRYFPRAYKTKASQWKRMGGFEEDTARDQAAMNACTHFIARDINSSESHQTGTSKAIAHGLAHEKIPLLR